MSETVSLEAHLAALAKYHGVDFDSEDLAHFGAAAQQGVSPDEMEQLVERYVADVYGDDYEDDAIDLDDDDDETPPPETGEAGGSVVGRAAAVQDYIGRRLTTSELERLESGLAARDWKGAETFAREAGVKSVDEMNHREQSAWMAERVDDMSPPPELVIPATDDGRPDFEAMDRNMLNAYMVARVEGAEFGEAD